VRATSELLGTFVDHRGDPGALAEAVADLAGQFFAMSANGVTLYSRVTPEYRQERDRRRALPLS
jgi:hypothetical protein